MDKFSKQPPITSFTDVSLNFPPKIKLENGIEMWVIDQGDSEICALSVFMAGGQIQEPKSFVSFLSSAMIYEGNASMTSTQISEQFDYLGSKKSVDVFDNHSKHLITSLNQNLKSTLDLVFKCFTSPTFPQKELDMVKHRMADAFRTQKKKVQYLASEELKRLYFGEHPMGRPISLEDIESLTPSELNDFYTRFYCPANCELILAGHITDKEIEAVASTFGKWQAPNNNKFTFSQPAYTPHHGAVSIIETPGAIQSAINLAIQAVPRAHPDYLKLRFTVVALGGYFGSRLMKNIREEKGYTYGINAILAGRADDGHIEISTQCDTRYTKLVLDEIEKEIDRLKNEPMGESEIETVRQNIVSDMVSTLDTPFALSSHVGLSIVYGTYPEYYNNQFKTVRDITAADIQLMAQRYLDTKKMITVIAGNKEQITQLMS